VAEALELYLEAERHRTNAIQSALALKGFMSDTEAADLLAKTRGIREKLNGAALLTRNRRHFERVPGIQLA
jgi:predicted nucleic acid-binding protein